MMIVISQENKSHNEEPLEFLIISFILMTFVFDSGIALLGEIQCLSLLGGQRVKIMTHLNIVRSNTA